MLLCLLWTSKIQKVWKQIMNLKHHLLRFFLRIKNVKNYTKSEGQDVVNYIGFLAWILALEGRIGDIIGIFSYQWKRFQCVWDSETSINKIYQKDKYSSSKMQCFTLGLLCSTVLGMMFFKIPYTHLRESYKHFPPGKNVSFSKVNYNTLALWYHYYSIMVAVLLLRYDVTFCNFILYLES